MKLQAKKYPIPLKAGETFAVFIYQSPKIKLEKQIPADIREVTAMMDYSHFRAGSGEIEYSTIKESPGIILCGLGKEESLSPEGLRNAAASVTSFCRGKKITSLNILIPVSGKVEEDTVIQSLAEGLSLANYQFHRYKKNEDKPLLKNFRIFSDSKKAGAIVKEVETVTANVLACRDLVNRNASETTPVDVAREAQKLSKLDNVSCKIMGKPELEKLKMGLLLAVNKGSDNPPRMVILQYRGGKKSSRSIAFVGKGITFDSGGMSLKISGGMEAMRMDMAGAAMALYAFKTAAELKLKVNLTAVIPLTENMLANNAYRPGDVFTSYSGKSVYIGNTDAEGRLILADALAYTIDKLTPDYIIDMATLTGACIVTFGETVAGLLGTSDELLENLIKASEKTGEQIWPLPLLPEFEENMKSDVADLSNMSVEKNAGTIHAASFLKQFTGETPWAHIDIAGTAWYSKARGCRPKNATGFGIQLLTEFLKAWDK